MCTYNNRFLTEGLVPFKGQCNGVNRFMFVYVIHCKINDKYYVGQHRCKPHINDPLNDNYRGSGLILKRFKAKYDWFKDFTFTILEFCENNTQLNQRELFWIDYYKQQYQTKCINVTTAENQSHFENSSVPIINLSTRQTFESMVALAAELNIPHYTVMKYIRERKRLNGDFYQRLDKVQQTSIEQQLSLCVLAEQKLTTRKRQNAIASKNRFQRAVRNLTTGELFSCVSDAARAYGKLGRNNSINSACKNHWKVYNCYWQYEDVVQQTSIGQQLQICIRSQQQKQTNRLNKLSQSGKSKRQPVVNLNTLTVYESATAASRSMNMSDTAVSVAIDHKVRCGGYYWAYKQDVDQQGLDSILQFYKQKESNNQEKRYKNFENHKRKIICEDGTEYESIVAVARTINCHASTVQQALKQHRRAKGKYYYYKE